MEKNKVQDFWKNAKKMWHFVRLSSPGPSLEALGKVSSEKINFRFSVMQKQRKMKRFKKCIFGLASECLTKLDRLPSDLHGTLPDKIRIMNLQLTKRR